MASKDVETNRSRGALQSYGEDAMPIHVRLPAGKRIYQREVMFPDIDPPLSPSASLAAAVHSPPSRPKSPETMELPPAKTRTAGSFAPYALALCILASVGAPFLIARQHDAPVTAAPRDLSLHQPPANVSESAKRDEIQPPPAPVKELTASPEEQELLYARRETLQPGWYVQVAAPPDQSTTAGILHMLRAKGFSAQIQEVQSEGARHFRILLGPQLSTDEARSLCARVKKTDALAKEAFVKRMP
jgi:cell division septation protein DedD